MVKPAKKAPVIKKGNNVENDESFATVTFTPCTEQYHSKLKADLEYLKKVLFQWSIVNSRRNLRNDSQLLKDYVRCHYEYYEFDQFDISFKQLDSINVNLENVVSEECIYKSYDLFRKCLWPVRFSSKFNARLQSYSYAQILYVLGFVMHIACGYVLGKGAMPNVSYGHARPLQTKTIPFNRFFTVKIFREKNLFLHIGMEKIPVVSRSNIIKRYEFRNYMQFLDILGDQYVEDQNKVRQRMTVFMETINTDVAKKDHSDQIEIDMTKYSEKTKYFFVHTINPYTGNSEVFDALFDTSDNAPFVPLPVKPYYVSTAETASLIFDASIKRWVDKEFQDREEKKKLHTFERQVNEEMIKRFVDFQSAKTLVELLTKIPNFNVALTEQEKDVIGQNGNVLAIGRSGTGKTTCAVLRLFSIEMLFKIRLSLYKKKFGDTIKDTRCSSQDIDSTIGLHSIFLTASPVLTYEIQRYYRRLTDNIKQELENKKRRVAEQKSLEQKKSQKEEKMRREENQIGQGHSIDPSQLQDSVSEPSRMEEVSKQEYEVLEEQLPKELNVLKSNKSVQQIEEEEHMQEQLKGIQLKGDSGNAVFEQDEENFDQVKEKFQQNIMNYHSLDDLKEKDYPGFFTVRSFIMMIDGSLQKPFFIRNKNIVLDQDSKAAWHNEKKGVMLIENYYRREEDEVPDEEDIQEEINYSDEEELEHEYLRQIQLREKRAKQQLTKKLQSKKAKTQVSFQVDYDYFVTHFWPNVQKKYYCTRNITPHLIWTEIYSTIKGSASSHLYPGQYMSQNVYLNSSTNTFLTKEEKLDVYETFCQYERWKIRVGAYDIMDAVNYILNYIRFRVYDAPEIHYIMIDEVQDLPHAMVYLLSKTATYGVFYSGDTAQTIAKGVGFRFCDLNSLFNPRLFESSLTLKPPIVKHLTINFRSHNNILQLANSVVSALEILFPKTIDRMKKEVSDLLGPKPMILAEGDEQLLFYVLCGDEQPKDEEHGLKKPPLQFGCEQVIIVRDQESKSKIPAMLQHALCLTIYEAKGLQFNDVILFNFFTESKCSEKWNLLKYLHVVDMLLAKDEYENYLTKHLQKGSEKDEDKDAKDKGVKENEIEELAVQFTVSKEQESYKVKKIVSDLSKVFKDINDYAELCSQLKLLYTAITRPRTTLIIYDEDSSSRKNIQRIWEKLQVVQLITKELVISHSVKASEMQEIKVFQRILVSTNEADWKKQGMKMYSRGYFEQAMKCFERSGNRELYNKALANKSADSATRKLIEVESERSNIKQGLHVYEKITSSDLAKLKKKLKADEKSAYEQFQRAAIVFEELLMFKQAGQCYFSGKNFELAFECFCKAFMHKQAGESLEMMNKYREAAQYYQRDGDYLKTIECLDMINEWGLILEKIQKFSDCMSSIEKQSLLKKYAALALEELVYEIEFEHDSEDKPGKGRVEVIQEKESDEEQEWDQDEDPEIEAEKQYQRKAGRKSNEPSRKQSEVSNGSVEQMHSVEVNVTAQGKKEESLLPEAIALDNSLQSFSEIQGQGDEQARSIQSFSQIDEGTAELANNLAPNAPGSFEVTSEKSKELVKLQPIVEPSQGEMVEIEESFGDINSKYDKELLPDLESIKSMVDPEDLWVKNSISEIQRVQSEYSASEDEGEYHFGAKIIKTKGNIFIQDEIMRKIVAIVCIVNPSVGQFFKQFKGYQSLITIANKDTENKLDRPEITQFEDIDPEFINTILDTLESFKLFKLCLFVCNRYHLPNRAGRYLTSVGVKYSTNCMSINTINPVLLAPSSYRKNELEKGILASIAMHAVLENVNSDFLKIKVDDNRERSKNSLGPYFIQGLILQGIYKKTIFMLDVKECLKVLSNFRDFNTYLLIYGQKMLKRTQVLVDDDPYLPQRPKHDHEVDYTIFCLQKSLFEYQVANRFETISNRYYKEYSSGSAQGVLETHRDFKIPEYIPFCQALVKSKQEIGKFLNTNILGCYRVLRNGTALEIFDIVSALAMVIHCEELQREVVKQLELDAFLEFYRCIRHINIAVHKIFGDNCLVFIDALFNLHQCVRIRPCKAMDFLGDCYSFVHRTSLIANQFVDNKGPSSFAYFFEQDYNLILVKTSKLLRVVQKRFDAALIRFYLKRTSTRLYLRNILPQDFADKAEERILIQALKVELAVRDKREKKIVKKENLSKKSKPAFNYKKHEKEEYAICLNESSSEEPAEQRVNSIQDYGLASFNPRMQYLSSPMLHCFLDKAKNAKGVIAGSQLYGCNMNEYYREYTERHGGFHLFDAIEFKKFGRLDLYASNIISILDELSLCDRHYYLAELMILLLVEHKAGSRRKEFKLELTTPNLKYLEGLNFQSLVEGGHQKRSDQEVHDLLKRNNQECVFIYEYRYVSDLPLAQLEKLICTCLQLYRAEEASQFVSFPDVILAYLINMSPSKAVYEELRRAISSLSSEWIDGRLLYMQECRSFNDFLYKREQLITNQTSFNKQAVMHQIRVKSTGDLGLQVRESELDYQIQGRIIASKRKAAAKIARWWRKCKAEQAERKLSIKNYFEGYMKSNSANFKDSNLQQLLGIRLLQASHTCSSILYDPECIVMVQSAKDQLLSFYLANSITLSLDFHFILMSLNQIHEYLEQYFSLCINYEQQKDSFDRFKQLNGQIREVSAQIQLWKSDTKWLREKNLTLKRKKVFEVKWMTKDLHIGKMIKKRAGLKKQQKLQAKKKALKKMEAS